MDYSIEPAVESDMPAILKVLEHYNMHHIPSKEMPSLELDAFYVARAGGKIIGVAGYKMLSETEGKTTLLAVDPEFCGQGIGKALQLRRMEDMIGKGAKKIITNADRPDSTA
jgi:ribosomal-protein-alanine N-acetyltransferase